MRRFETSHISGNPASLLRGETLAVLNRTLKSGIARGDPREIPRGRGDPEG